MAFRIMKTNGHGIAQGEARHFCAAGVLFGHCFDGLQHGQSLRKKVVWMAAKPRANVA
jgi:hypothetical protein